MRPMKTKLDKSGEQTHADRLLTEKQFQAGFEELAHLYDYRVAHFRPAMKRDGTWVTAVSADGVGFPDNLCVKEHMPPIFAELKSEGAKLSPAQAGWHRVLSAVPGIRVFVFYPKDYPQKIADILQGKA